MPSADCEPTWRQAAAEKAKELDSHIPTKWRVPPEKLNRDNATNLPYETAVMTKRDLVITELTAVNLLSLIASKIYTAAEVCTAFCKRAAIAHQATNCVASFLFDSAYKRAQELDIHLMRTGKLVGPLHGLPVSVKEHIDLAGTPATSGLVAWKDNMSPEDALIVKILREAGAIFHVKTTNPQTLMSLETNSNLFGRTVNAFNRNLTPGGSSGGEAALIAMRGSVLGIGTDIGGSIRVPSAFSGGYGLKGSIARLPHGGLSGLSAGMEAIIGCVGPMANSLEDLRLFCKVALDYEPWRYEPSLTPMPWKPTRAANLPKKLKIGVMWDDGMVQPHPPVTMALRQAVELLKKDGHEIIDWDSKNCKETFAWINRAYFLDGADEYREILNPATDPPTKYMQYMFDNIATKRYTLEESWKINAEHDKVRMMYAEQLRQTGVDAMICPVAPTVAAAHEETLHWAYSAMWNALDLPGVVLPMGKVEEWHTWEECGIEKRLARSDMEAFYQECYKNGPSKYRDAPTSVQLIGERLQEEKLLAIAEVLDGLLEVEKAKAASRSESAKTTNIVVSSKMPVESVVEVNPLQQLVVRS